MNDLNNSDPKVSERENLIREEDEDKQEKNPQVSAPRPKERTCMDGCDTDTQCCCFVPIKIGF